MRLICPSCGAQYEIDAALLPAAGRDVECSGCNHIWHQPGQPLIAPVKAEIKALPKPLPEASAAPLSRPLSAAVLNILREEAEREQAARAAEAQAGTADPVAEPEAAQVQEAAPTTLPQVYVDESVEDASPDDDSDDWPATTIIISAPDTDAPEAIAPDPAPAETARPAASQPSVLQTRITSQPVATDTTPEPIPVRRPIHRVRPNTLPDADQLAATLVPPAVSQVAGATAVSPAPPVSAASSPQVQTTPPPASRYAAGFTTALAMLALVLALYLAGGTQPHDSPLGQFRDTLDQIRAALAGLLRG